MGIDPGVATTGCAIVERDGGRLRALDFGAVTTPGNLRHAQRLLRLHRELTEILDRHEPEVVAVERVFFNANVRTAMSVGQASGVALLAAAESGLEAHDYTPTEVKS